MQPPLASPPNASHELRLPRLHRASKSIQQIDVGPDILKDQFIGSTSPTTTTTTSNSSPTTTTSEPRNPFKMPTDDEIFILRDEERKRIIEDRERMKDLKVHEKMTHTFKNSINGKVHKNNDPTPELATTNTHSLKSQPVSPTRRMTRSLDIETVHTNKHSGLDKMNDSSNALNGTPENLTQFVASKREMFLMSYSLTVKREEIQKLTSLASERELALHKAEKMLEEDTSRFDAFLKENNLKTMEATKRADAETKSKLDKAAEIKRYTLQIGTIKNEMAKFDEQLEDCKKFKDFLDAITPEEWFNKDSNASSDPIQGSMFFTKPSQLLSIFKTLEESNMFLIQNSQETEKVLEELQQNLKETAVKLDGETSNLKSQISVLEEAITKEESRWNLLEEKAYKNFGTISLTNQETILQDLHLKVVDMYSTVIGDTEISTLMNLDTLIILTNIEHYMEELFKQQNNLPQTYLTAAIKSKEKEHRVKQRTDKIEKQKMVQELRIKKSLERSQAPIQKKATKPIMFRSILPKETKEQQQQTGKDQNTEDLVYFGLL